MAEQAPPAAAAAVPTKAELEAKAQEAAAAVQEGDQAHMQRLASLTKAQLAALLWQAGRQAPAAPGVPQAPPGGAPGNGAGGGAPQALDAALNARGNAAGGGGAPPTAPSGGGAGAPSGGGGGAPTQPPAVAPAPASELSRAQQRDAGWALLRATAHGKQISEEFRACLRGDRSVPYEVRAAVDRMRSGRRFSENGRRVIDRAERGTPLDDDDFSVGEVFELAQCFLFAQATLAEQESGPTISSERNKQLRYFMDWQRSIEERPKLSAGQLALAAEMGMALPAPPTSVRTGGGGGGGGGNNARYSRGGGAGKQQGAAGNGGVLPTPKACFICGRTGHLKADCPEKKRPRGG